MKNSRLSSYVRNAVRAVLSLSLVLFFTQIPNLTLAQSSSSGINGVVTDPSGAAVPNANVVLTNVDTNVQRTTISNGSGDYFFGSLPPARYTLTFTAQGFQKVTISAFDVNVAQVVTLNAILKVGSIEQSVTVTATNTEVESSTAQLGSVIGTQSVNDLPLNGRNFTQLLDLTPGVTPISTGQNHTASNTPNVSGSDYNFPSINGAYNRSTLYMLDGMNNNNAWYNAYAVPPIIDTIQEFKINSHSDSQYGGVIGGVVNMASKAGSNSYHGSAWEYVRSNSFDAKQYFVAPNSYHLNTFGGQAGGPVRFPHLYNGTDKTFFEIGYEETKYSKAGSSNILIPTAAQLGESTFGGAQDLAFADFSSASTGVTKNGTCNATDTSTSKAPCQLYDPTIANNAATPNRPAYTGNQVPVSEFNKNSMAFINAVFGKSGPIVIPGIAPTNKNYQITDPTRQTTYNYTARLDQHIGTRDFIFARYSEFQSRQTSPSSLPTLFSISQNPAQEYGVSWNHVFSPTTSMQVQYARAHIKSVGVTQFNNHKLWQAYGCSTSMCNDFVGGASLLVSQNVTNGFSGGESNSPSDNLSSVHEWTGSVIKVLGNHQLEAGGGWDEDNYTAELRQGAVGFTGASTANFGAVPGQSGANPSSPAGISAAQISAQSGFGLLDFLLDYPNTENKRNVLLTERPGGIGSIFLQDSWKMTPKLTLNYGIRYDRSVIPAFGTDASVGLQGSIETGDFDFTNGTYIIQKLPPLCSVRHHAPCLPSATLPANVVVASGSKIMHGSKMNFGPRFGFAYRVNNGLSVRGGFGIFWDNWSALIQMPQNYQGSWPDTGTLQIDSTNTPGTVYTSAQDPFAQNGGNLPAATPFTSSNVNYMVSPYWKNPYSEQFNFGLEKQLWFGSILSLNYVGSATHRMDIGGYYNTGTVCGAGCPYASFAKRQAAGVSGQPMPQAAPQKSWDHAGANGTYNSLQATFQRTYSSGLGYLVSYTWSKTLDEGGDGFFGVEGGVPQDPYNPKESRGPASFNIPHMLAAHFVYNLPFGTGRKFSTGSRVADYAIGNWQITGIVTGRSGQNFDVTAGGDIAETGNGKTYERANRVGDPYKSGPVSANPSCIPPSGNVRTLKQWFNPCAFVAPQTGTLGTFGRNVMQAQNYWNFDTSVSRQFPIREGLSFDLKAEAFNALNHPVLSGPAATVTTLSSFGQITGTASESRIVQLSGKLKF